MIRKKRETTQVDLFDGGIPMKKNQNTELSGAFSKTVSEKNKQTLDSGNPILMGKNYQSVQKTTSTEESGELISFDQILGENQKNDSENEIYSNEKEVTDPGTDDIPVKPLIDEDTDDVIINKDFADGFYAGRSQKESTANSDSTVLNQRRKQKRSMKLVVIGLLLASLILALNWDEWITQSSMFTLKTIDVQGCEITGREEVIAWSGLKPGVRLGTIEGPAVAGQLMKQPFFRQVVVSKHYPSSVSIRVEERKPIAFVAMDDLHPIDADGIILPKLKTVRSYNIPIVTGIRAAVKTGSELKAPGVTVVRHFLETAQSRYPALYFELSEIEYAKDALKIYMNAWPFPFLADSEAPERSLVYLEAVMESFRKSAPGNRIREIDIRYDNKMIIRNK